jgi:hypothetical protein
MKHKATLHLLVNIKFTICVLYWVWYAFTGTAIDATIMLSLAEEMLRASISLDPVCVFGHWNQQYQHTSAC